MGNATCRCHLTEYKIFLQFGVVGHEKRQQLAILCGLLGLKQGNGFSQISNFGNRRIVR